jgi:hypothetical protein
VSETNLRNDSIVSDVPISLRHLSTHTYTNIAAICDINRFGTRRYRNVVTVAGGDGERGAENHPTTGRVVEVPASQSTRGGGL